MTMCKAAQTCCSVFTVITYMNIFWELNLLLNLKQLTLTQTCSNASDTRIASIVADHLFDCCPSAATRLKARFFGSGHRGLQ